MQKRRFYQSGMTLLELMIATAIVSIIASISISSYNGYIVSSNNSKAVSEIKALSFLIDDFARNNGGYPVSLADVSNGNLIDPWGKPYAYLNLSTVKGKSEFRKDGKSNPINLYYDLYSNGPDGNTKFPISNKFSRDDIIYANDGDFVGIASDF